MREKGATPDAQVAKIAARQHGVVSQAQLIEAGLSTSAISRRVENGRLHRIYQRVYAVGHPGIPQYGRWMAAALTCGEGAAVSHRSAAELWGLLSRQDGPVHVSVVGTAGRRQRRSGLLVHRRRTLTSEATTRRLGIPVTKPAQTIADLRRSVSPKELRHAIRQASVLGLPIGEQADDDRTRSELERDFLRLCHRHRLPSPEVNVRIGPHLVDFLWRRERLIVETDGYRFHRGSLAFEDDHARDLDLRALGYDVRRFTYRQLRDEPCRIAADLRDALGPAS